MSACELYSVVDTKCNMLYMLLSHDGALSIGAHKHYEHIQHIPRILQIHVMTLHIYMVLFTHSFSEIVTKTTRGLH